MIIPKTILSMIVKHHQKTGDKAGLRLATARYYHFRSVFMYGYDHPITVRYRETMYRIWREVI